MALNELSDTTIPSLQLWNIVMSQQLHPLPPLMGGSSDEGDMSQTLYFPQESNEMSGGLPINLDSLRDGPPGSKPFYPYSTLLRYVLERFVYISHGLRAMWPIRYAIKGSPNQKLLLEDIYFAIESRVRLYACCDCCRFNNNFFKYAVPLLQNRPCGLESEFIPLLPFANIDGFSRLLEFDPS